MISFICAILANEIFDAKIYIFIQKFIVRNYNLFLNLPAG